LSDLVLSVRRSATTVRKGGHAGARCRRDVIAVKVRAEVPDRSHGCWSVRAARSTVWWHHGAAHDLKEKPVPSTAFLVDQAPGALAVYTNERTEMLKLALLAGK